MTDTSELNDSSILRDFSAEYDQLKSQNKEQASRIEELNQEVHSLRNRLQVADKIQIDYQTELECQQQQIAEMTATHAAAVAKLKEDCDSTVKDYEHKVQVLENGLQEIDQKHALDKADLLKTQKELRVLQDSSPVATLKAELQEIMEEHAANRVACIQHQELNKILLDEKANLLEELSNTREHLEMTEEKLKICKADLTEQAETLEDLRESLAVTQNELACLKSGPSDVERGNSLFAEVEDKRQAMLKKFSSLAKKYSDMKRDYGAKCSEISNLKRENLRLRRKWQEEAEERDNRDVWLVDNYKIRIKELTKMVEELKQEEKPVFINGNSQVLTYAEHVVKESRQKLSALQEEMEWRSSQRLNEAKALYLARSELQTLKADVMSLHAENLVLRDKLDEANITDIPSPGKTLQKLRETMQRVDEIAASSSPTLALPVGNNASNLSDGTSQRQTVGINNSDDDTNNEESDKLIPSLSHSALLEMPQEESIPVLIKEVEITQEETSPVKMLEEETSPVKMLEEETSPVKMPEEQTSPIKIQEEEISPVKILEKETSPVVTPDPDFIPPNLKKPRSAVILEQPEKHLSDANPTALVLKNVDEPASTFKEPWKGSTENQFESEERGSKGNPRRSILFKASRPSLMPIDQNSIRKVRFATTDLSSAPLVGSECKAEEETQKDSPKKKLIRIPQPKTYKTRVIVSRELV